MYRYWIHWKNPMYVHVTHEEELVLDKPIRNKEDLKIVEDLLKKKHPQWLGHRIYVRAFSKFED